MIGAIQFALNGALQRLSDTDPAMTLLDWLRQSAGLRGTKEGCAEGDCGACTVLVERLDKTGRIRREAINSCITMIGQIDGLGIRTVEGLTSDTEPVHPIQKALADEGGTQCGFCTPGIVMSSYAYVASHERADVEKIHDALAGNLCRCTGYRGIVNAISRMTPLGRDPIKGEDDHLASTLKALCAKRTVPTAFAPLFFKPASLPELLSMRADHPDGRILCGGTDLGLHVSRDRESLGKIIHVGVVPELNVLSEDSGVLVIGAAVTYSEAQEVLLRHFPNLTEYYSRLGSVQIRNMGTIGGNLGTASPIGDSLPILIAAGAGVTVNSKARGPREVAVGDFLLGYRKTALEPDEIIESIRIPLPPPDSVFFADKISKRRDQDISSVCVAYSLRMEGRQVVDIRIAFGGMGPVTQRARKVEQALRGRELTEASVAGGEAALRTEFSPISDLRASAEYRLDVAANLLRRLYYRVTNPAALSGAIAT